MYRLHKYILTGLIVLLAVAVVVVGVPRQAAASDYTDIGNHWAREAIIRWETLGALRDFAPGAFRPNTPITRAEFFALLVRVFAVEQGADISRFTDVPKDAWYYDIVAKANQMRIAEGTSTTTMHPEANIIRQDAATLVARAIGIANDNQGYISQYGDREFISPYAESYVSAMTEFNYMVGSGGYFYPRSNLSRAEAVKIVDNLFTHYYRSELGFDGLTLTGNLLSNRPDTIINNLTLHGDLILADGVGEGNAALNDCTIEGRLLVRGGGPSSVVLSNTTVRGGITMISPSNQTRVVTTGTTQVPKLTAFSSFILSGTGVHAVRIADNAFSNIAVTLEGVVLDSLDMGGRNAEILMPSGKITNLRFLGDGADALFLLGSNASVDYLSIAAPNVNVQNEGTVGNAFINAPGAVLSKSPLTYSISGNISATIATETVSGQSLNTANVVDRSLSNLAVTQDEDETGGEDLYFASGRGRSTNNVTVTQKPLTKIPLSRQNWRWGYYIGFFIPAPAGADTDEAPLVTYQRSDGGLVSIRNYDLTEKDGRRGLEFHVPVTRDANRDRGRLDETLYIEWSGTLSENILFYSGWLDLEPLTNHEINRLVNYYYEAEFEGYNGKSYAGSEAIRRLLASDNPLGLDTKGFAALPEDDQIDLAHNLYEYSNSLTSREAIQEMIDQVISGKGALYAVNRALTTEQMQGVLETKSYAKELGIDISSLSSYGILSETGKSRVAYTILSGRKKDFTTAAAVKSAFDKAVETIKSTETAFLIALNACKVPADIQKVIETKNYADLLGFTPSSDPYKSYTSPLKTALYERIFSGITYRNVDDVAEIIRNYLATVDPGSANPEDDKNITSIKVTPSALTNLAVGDRATLTLEIVTPSGVVTSLAAATWVIDKPEIASIDPATGTVTAKAAGTAKLTVTSVNGDKNKSVSVSIKVAAKVSSTGIKLNRTYVEMEEGSSYSDLVATLVPAKSTDSLTWSSDNPAIATVDANGIITGVSSGFTHIMVRTTSDQRASCLVAVVGKEPGIMVYPASGSLGIDGTIQFYAAVAPYTAVNRTVLWESADSSIAKVTGGGLVTGVGTGGQPTASTTITVYSANKQLSATIPITVDNSLLSLKLDKTKITLYPSGKEQITATILPQGSTGNVVWAPGPGSGAILEVETVDGKGIVKALAAGKGTVIASLDGDNTSVIATCEVEVLEGSPKITLKTGKYSLSLGATQYLDITFEPDSINKTVEWNNTSPEIAYIDENNQIHAVGTGGKLEATTRISGVPQADTTKTLEVTVTVTQPAVRSFSLTPLQLTMVVGDEALLSKLFSIKLEPSDYPDKTISWYSGDREKVSVESPTEGEMDAYGGWRLRARSSTVARINKEPVLDGDGKQMLGDDGKPLYNETPVHEPVKLTASIGGKDVEVQIIVNESAVGQVTNVKIKSDAWIFKPGITQNLELLFNITGRNTDGSWIGEQAPANPRVNWESSNENIAEVDGAGKLTTKREGQAIITVTTNDGNYTDRILVVVAKDGVSDLTLSGLTESGYQPHLSLLTGETKQVEISVNSGGADIGRIYKLEAWKYEVDADLGEADTSIQGSDIISITDGGAVTAKKPGLVKVTVTPDQQEYKTMTTIAKLEQLCQAAGKSFDEYLDKNGIVKDGNDYYSRNEMLFSFKGLTIAKIPLGNGEYMLIVPDAVPSRQAKSFFVNVQSPVVTGIRMASDAPSVANPGQTVKLSARVEPAYVAANQLAGKADIVWSESPGQFVLVDGSVTYEPQSGVTTATYQVPAEADLGGVEVKVEFTSAAEYGLKPRPEYAETKPQYQVPSKTVETSQTIRIETAPQPLGFSALSAPLTTDQSEQATATEQPAAAPQTAPVQQVVPAPTATANVAAGGQSLALWQAAKEAGITPASVSSSNPAVAVVDARGIVTGAAAGSTVVTASAADGRAVSVSLTVEQRGEAASASKSLKIRSSASVSTGKTLILAPQLAAAGYDASAISWESSKPEIATVDANGLVAGVKEGKAVITASIPGTSIKSKCTVTVSAAPKTPLTGLNLSETALTLEAGKTKTLKATLQPTTASYKGISWFSTNSAVAAVDLSGKITAVAAGSATIVAISDDGAYAASCTVTVTPKPVKVTGITMSEKTLALTVGEQALLTYTIAPVDATDQSVTWKSSNEKVVTVVDGQIVAIKKGTATITVTTNDGKKRATCKITVK